MRAPCVRQRLVRGLVAPLHTAQQQTLAAKHSRVRRLVSPQLVLAAPTPAHRFELEAVVASGLFGSIGCASLSAANTS